MKNISRNINLSSDAKKVLEQLTGKQKKTIRKDNPFKKERNVLICELRARGVLPGVLAEITGLSRVSIGTIARNKGYVDDVELTGLKMHLKQLQRVVGKLGYYIEKIKQNRSIKL